VRSGDIAAFRLRTPAAFDADAAGLEPARLERYRVPKVVVPGMFRRLCAAWDARGELVGRVYFVPVPAGRSAARERALLLALLNSRLYAWLYAGLFAAVAQSGGWLRANAPYLHALPWPERGADAGLVAIVRRLDAEDSAPGRERLDDWVETAFGLDAEERGHLARLDERLAATDQASDPGDPGNLRPHPRQPLHRAAIT
jgi:hypothetical protein